MSSGDVLAICYPGDNEPQASNPCIGDERAGTRVMDFAETANYVFAASKVLSSKYTAAANITIKAIIAATSATTGDSDWDFELARIGTSVDIDSVSYGTLVSVDNTNVPGTSRVLQVITATMSGGALNSLAAGELFRVRVTNDAASDTRSGDMELYALVLLEA